MWETKDVLLAVGSVAGLAGAWALAQAKVASLERTLAEFKAAIQAELKELKRDTKQSALEQGKRLGEIEQQNRIQREIAKLVGRGTPALGTLIDQLRAPPPPRESGAVDRSVDDGSSNEGSKHE